MAPGSRPAGYFKVAFDLEPNSAGWPPFRVERIWARKTGVVGELEVCNAPFFVRGVARGDVVKVHPDHERRELVFDEVVRHTGHSTVRVIINDGAAKEPLLTALSGRSCTWEFSDADLHLAVDVPSSCDYPELLTTLLELKQENLIGIEEAYVSPGHRSRPAT
jgi:hypothetical protein